jgi:phosphoglycolate phosphatase-like HAD superfamily hydrolase
VTFLVLFDVDGTLLLTHDEVYVEANREALRVVWGAAPEGPDIPGDTALAHTRRALRGAGFCDAEIDEGLERWCSEFSSRYVQLLNGADTSHWQVPRAARETLGAIERRALLTGNPEAVARARMKRIGLAAFFPPGQGAFGCEREDRVALFELARHRGGNWPAERTAAVGDTPLDVATAHRAGARCVAVTSGAYDRDQLADADRVVSDFADVPGAVATLE